MTIKFIDKNHPHKVQKRTIDIYDTTLRDGNQTLGVNFSVTDKIKIAQRLDDCKIGFIEGGWPNRINKAEVDFFKKIKKINLSATITAFGRTLKPETEPEDDEDFLILSEVEPDAVTLMGKTWKFHVHKILETTLQENLLMIRRSIQFFSKQGFQVFFDAEHFFDGFKEDREYTFKVLREALSAGATTLVLCDTRGVSTTPEIVQSVKEVVNHFKASIGIHTHNDRGLATANSLSAIYSGVSHVQGTINGLGERCGNADLIEIICNLETDQEFKTAIKLNQLSSLSSYISEITNLTENVYKPFVGRFAFAHKGGIHAHAVLKKTEAYEGLNPEKFGNKRMIAVSSQSGVSNIRSQAIEFGFNQLSRERAQSLLRKVKDLESKGYNFENANASLFLLYAQELNRDLAFFDLLHWRVYVLWQENRISIESSVKIKVGDREILMVGEGNGPVNAFDVALRKALTSVYPEISRVKLVGYRVRELDVQKGTEAKVRVFIEFNANGHQWSAIGVSTNILEASEKALVEGYTYYLHRMKKLDI